MAEKFIIYQMLPRLFGNMNPECVKGGTLMQNGSGKFGDISSAVLDEIKKLSVTHIWYTGVIRHATKGDRNAKGEAGSPYAVKDYYDVNPYLAYNTSRRMDEFVSLVERTHEAGVRVILDFVPNHVSCDYSSPEVPFTDYNFYPGRIHDGDWADTVKLNYSVEDTWLKMRDILLFWASKGVDGFRCDMVELVPVSFWNWCIPEIKAEYPGVVFIAEIYNPSNYYSYVEKGGFDYLYDKAGFYDHLRSISTGDMPASALTDVWQSLGALQPKMLNFLENHDEQRLASDFYLSSPLKANASLAVSLFFNTAPFMLYSGQEFGERGMDAEGFSGVDGRTSIYDFWSVSAIRRWLGGLKNGKPEQFLSEEESAVYSLYRTYLEQAVSIPAVKEGLTYDLEYANPYSEHFNPRYHFAFLRYADGETYLCAANFSGTIADVEIFIPDHAFDYFDAPKPSTLITADPIDIKIEPFSAVLKKL